MTDTAPKQVLLVVVSCGGRRASIFRALPRRAVGVLGHWGVSLVKIPLACFCVFDITHQSGRGFDARGDGASGAPKLARHHTAAGTWAQSTVAQTGEDVALLGDAITFER